MTKPYVENLILNVLAKYEGVWATEPTHEELTRTISYLDLKVNRTWSTDMISELIDRMAKRRWYISHLLHDSKLRIVYKSV